MPELGLSSAVGSTSERKADNSELWLEEAIDQMTEEAGEDTWQLLVGDGLGIGRMVDIVLAANGYWWDYPKDLPEDLEERHEALKAWQQAAPVPTIWRHIPAETAFPPSLGRMSDEVLVVQNILLADVLDHYGASETVLKLKDGLKDTKGAYLYEPVELLTYANRKYMAWGLRHGAFGPSGATELLQTYEHNMDVCPIRITPTFIDPRKKPGRYWTCPAMEAVHLVKSLDKRMSEWATFSRMSVGSWVFEVFSDDLAAEGTANDLTKRQWGDATLLRVNPENGQRENIRSVAPPEVGQSISELVSLGLSLIERKTGISPALAGQGLGGGDVAAASIKINTSLAQELYKPASINLTRHGKSVGERVLAAVAAFGETARLSLQGESGEGRTLELTPEEAKGWVVNVKAELEPQFEVTRHADMGIYLRGVEMAAQGMRPWGDRYGIERLLRESDVQGFKREKLLDDFSSGPEWKGQVQAEAWAKARARLAAGRMATQKDLEDAQAEGLFDVAPAVGDVLRQRGKLPQGNTEFPAAATPQSAAQTGVVPATIQEPRDV